MKINLKTKFGKIKAAILIILLISSCLSQNKELQEIQFQERMRSFDQTTNRYCTSIGLEFSRENPIRSEMFFRCKIELARRAKIENPIKPNEIIFNKDLKQFIEFQDNQYMNSIENLNYYRNSILNNAHHDICQKRGYNFDSLNQDKIEDYLNCRESLIMQYEIKPAYQNYQDLNYPQSSYNIDYVVNEKQDLEIKKAKEFAKNYPFCHNLKVGSQEAISCKNAYDEREKCTQNIKKESYLRNRMFQEICQQKLYIKLPDSLLIKNKSRETRARKHNFNTDLYLNSSYYQFLSDKKVRDSFISEDENKKKKKREESEKKINNTYDQLYTKDQLTGLRTQFINSCMNEVEPKVEKFVNAGIKTCRSITLKWDNKIK